MSAPQSVTRCRIENYYIEAMEKSLKYSSNQTPSLINLAIAYQNIGNAPKLLETLNRLIEVDPRSFRGNYMLAQYYIGKDEQKARFYFQKVKDSFLYFAGRYGFGPYEDFTETLAYHYKDYNFLVKFYNKVLEYRKDNGNYYKNLGLIYYNQNPRPASQTIKVIELFKTALKLNPNIEQATQLKQIVQNLENEQKVN